MALQFCQIRHFLALLCGFLGEVIEVHSDQSVITGVVESARCAVQVLVRDRTDSTIYDHVYADDLIINGQIRKAWPAAKIIRTLPGTAFNEVRNLLWTNRYTPLIRAMQQSIIDRADPKTIIAPVWAMTNPEAAYAYSAAGAANDGFKAGDWSDAVHPIGASRHALYQALAPFVAAAALDII
ncbi:hypothetical protein AWM69_10475 [Pseudomonas sp. D1HM]|nr:hypothetical protein [Pseudomonas sp. D1HM]